MMREIVVLRRQQGVDEVLRNLGEPDGAAAHFTEFGNEFGVGAVDAQGNLHAHVAQGFHRGQVRAEIQEGAAQAEQHGAEQGDTGPRQKLQEAHRKSCLSGGWVSKTGGAGKRQKLFTL